MAPIESGTIDGKLNQTRAIVEIVRVAGTPVAPCEGEVIEEVIMRTLLRTTTLLGMLMFGAVSLAEAQVSFNVHIGAPPPPRVVHVVPARPGPGYYWIDGYWYPVGNHYKWRNGHWARPPYSGARWYGPRYSRNQYRVGYWDGHRGRYDDHGHYYRH